MVNKITFWKIEGSLRPWFVRTRNFLLVSVLRIRIRMFFSLLDPDPLVKRYRYGSGSFYHEATIIRKTFDPYFFWLVNDFLLMKNDLNVPSNSKVISRKTEKTVFCLRLEDQWRKLQDPDPDPLVRGTDPDPYQNVTDPQHCSVCYHAFRSNASNLFWYFLDTVLDTKPVLGIRIRMFLGLPDPHPDVIHMYGSGSWSFNHKAKIVRKTLISTVLYHIFFMTFIFEESKMM